MPTYTAYDHRGNTITFDDTDINAAKERGTRWIRAGYTGTHAVTGTVRSDTENAAIVIDPAKPITFNPKQRQQAIELLWEYLMRDGANSGRRQTGWGNKTLSGLIECLETIAYEESRQ